MLIVDENYNKDIIPKIKGVIKKKFDGFFWRCYQEYQKPTFKIINTDAKDEIGITNQTFKNGLQFLAQEGYLIYENEKRKRDTEITLTEKYISELRKDYEDKKSAISYAEIMKRVENQDGNDTEMGKETVSEQYSNIDSTLSTHRNDVQQDLIKSGPVMQTENLITPIVQHQIDDIDYSNIIPFITPFILEELDRRREKDIKEIKELRTEVGLLKSMINSFEMAKRSQDSALNVIKDQIKILEEKILNK